MRRNQEWEDPAFLGDAVFASYLERLSGVRRPLILSEDGGTIAASRVPGDTPGFWERGPMLTEGREVLGGREDHVRLNGKDRWLGGVHLAGEEAGWRWGGTVRRPVRVS